MPIRCFLCYTLGILKLMSHFEWVLAGKTICDFNERAAGQSFFNTSKFDFSTLLGDAHGLRVNLLNYVSGFSPVVHDIFECYEFEKQLPNLDAANLLY